MKKRRARTERRRASATKRAKEHKTSFGSTAFRIPDGMELLVVDKEETRRFDIIEYEVGEGNPSADAGMLHYERTFWVHPRIGVDESSYVCPAKTFRKRCPVCDDRRNRQDDSGADPETIKALLPKERQLFLIVDVKEDDKGVQLYENSYHSFGRTIDERLKGISSDPDSEQEEIDAWESFATYDNGSTLKVQFIDEDIGQKNPWRRAKNIDLIPRKKQYEESILDEMPCLDDLPIELSYDELKKIYFQIEDDAEAVTASKGKPPKGLEENDNDDRREEEPEDDDWDEDEDEDEDVEGEDDSKLGEDEEPSDWGDDGEEEEEDPEPVPKKKKKAKKSFNLRTTVKKKKRG